MSTLTIDRTNPPHINGQPNYKPFPHLQRDESSTSASKKSPILAELYNTLSEINQVYNHIDQRLSLIHRFTTIINQKLWDAYENQPRYHQHLAILIKMALRQTVPSEMTVSQVGAFLEAIESLANPELTFEDTILCDKRFRAAGLETLIGLGQHREPLMELYGHDKSE